MSPSRFNPWPWAIIAWFLVMIVICVGFVIKSLGMKHDLVTQNYYAEGLDHDRRQSALSRTRGLETPPRIELDTAGHRMILRLPEFAKGAVLKLYRPSDARLDLKYALQDGAPSVLSTLDLHPGKWQARISWETGGVPYYHQEDVFIQ
jgi:hypothetical protein